MGFQSARFNIRNVYGNMQVEVQQSVLIGLSPLHIESYPPNKFICALEGGMHISVVSKSEFSI